MSERPLTRGIKRDYRALSDVNIPRCQRTKKYSAQDSDGPLYPISIVANNGEGLVKIHYVGYGNEHDQWRKLEEIVGLITCCVKTERYDLHQDLAGRIKSALYGRRKANPVIKVVMPFDQTTFNEGLRSKGCVFKTVNGIVHYKIRQYSDLNDLLGEIWHYRGLNSTGDYCYVISGTVRYHLYRRRPIIQYISDNNGFPMKTCIPQAYMLNFSFVRGDGTPSDFGTNPIVFLS